MECVRAIGEEALGAFERWSALGAEAATRAFPTAAQRQNLQ